MIFTAEADLIACGLYWQRQLRLEDWDVVYHLRHRHHMEDAEGHCHALTTQRKADVCLVYLEEHEWPNDYDMEQTLVHELLHIPNYPWFQKKGEIHHDGMEQFIDSTAWVLVRLNRGFRR